MNLDNDTILRVEEVTVNKAGGPILQNISFTLYNNDHLAITGESGSGKTTLGLALCGHIFYKGDIHFAPEFAQNIVWVEQQHHFKNISNTTDFYYQQRFNSYDAEQTLTVKEALSQFGNDAELVLQSMRIEYLIPKPLIQLSNGENKKLQIAKALLAQPTVLIMDQPFTGLDSQTRDDLHTLINRLAKQNILIVLITSCDEIPVCITKVISLQSGKIKSIEGLEYFYKNYLLKNETLPITAVANEELKKLTGFSKDNFTSAIKMKNVNVQYGEKKILQHINWEVRRGERWLLSGPNGAGKSTLLSLVTADNPQGYANEIYLFDRRRGSGESIWDIKNKIGYLSPELHLFFDQSCTCFEAVASGLFDTIGLFKKLSDHDIELVSDWLRIMNLEKLQHKNLYSISTGEQRIVLLARALLKNPPMLVLDEPCQGLDKEKQTELLDLIDTVCLYGNKTMVFVTHYHNEKPSCIDHFIKLENGKIIQSGSYNQ
jgi:molybdate transport system ATP-binding protein